MSLNLLLDYNNGTNIIPESIQLGDNACDEISTDATMADNSDAILCTQKAIKAYVNSTSAVVVDRNGFEDPDDVVMIRAGAGKSITIGPVGTSYNVWSKGNLFTKTAVDFLDMSNDVGLHLLYFDESGVLLEHINPTDDEIAETVLENCIVAWGYWDGTNMLYWTGKNEFHGIIMSPATHGYLHRINGSKYLSGMALDDIIANGDGTLDTTAQFSIPIGEMLDEDIMVSMNAITSTKGIPIFWRDGTSNWMSSTTAEEYISHAVAGRAYYNLDTAGTWSRVEVDSSDYVLVHVFASNHEIHADALGKADYITVMGQDTYGNRNQARIGANEEINNLVLSGLPFAEFVPIASIIFESRDAYTNYAKSRIRTTDEGEDYVDWRFSEVSPTIGPTSHGSLSGLLNDDHAQYPLLKGRIDDHLTVNFTATEPIPDTAAIAVHSNSQVGLDRSIVCTAHNDVATMPSVVCCGRTRGTYEAPEQCNNGDWIGAFCGAVYDGGAYPLKQIEAVLSVATQDHTPLNFGNKIQFYTTPDNSQVPRVSAEIGQDAVLRSNNISELTPGDLQIGSTAGATHIGSSTGVEIDPASNSNDAILVLNKATFGDQNIIQFEYDGNPSSSIYDTTIGDLIVNSANNLYLNANTGKNVIVTPDGNGDSGFTIQRSGPGDTNYITLSTVTNGNAAGFVLSPADALNFVTGSGTPMVMTQAGNITINGSTYLTVASDLQTPLYINGSGLISKYSSLREHKMNIEPMVNADFLYDIVVSQYNRRKSTMEFAGETSVQTFLDDPVPKLEYGVIAEDVELINPELCIYDDEDNNTGLSGISPTEFTFITIKCVQEQKKEIDALRTEIDSLKVRDTGLEAMLSSLLTRITDLEAFHAST